MEKEPQHMVVRLCCFEWRGLVKDAWGALRSTCCGWFLQPEIIQLATAFLTT